MACNGTTRTMATDISPYDVSRTLQYIGVRFHRFVYAIQQGMEQDGPLPSHWFRLLCIEIVSTLVCQVIPIHSVLHSSFWNECLPHATALAQ